MSRLALALATLCVLSLLASAGVGAGGSADVSISGVTVSPTPPVPGEQVTVTATVRNLPTATSDYEIDEVILRSPLGEGDSVTYDEVADLGSLAPGTDLQVPLTATFDEPGTYDLRVRVTGTNDEGRSITFRYPVTITVRDEHPGVDISVERPIEGVETTATVTLANGLDRDLRSVAVTLDGLPTDSNRKVQSVVRAGETTTFTYTVTPDAARSEEVTARVGYTLGSGVTRSTRASTTVEVSPLRERVTLDAIANPATGAVQVTVTNLGNTNVEGVVVEGRSDSLAVGRATVPELAPRASAQLTLPVQGLDPLEDQSVAVSATYDVVGRDGYTGAVDGGSVTFESTQTPTPEEVPAEIELTGVFTEVEDDGTVRISGSASNTGLETADAVIVRVVAADGVVPAEPNREYYVGGVPRNEFVSFDVYADIDDGVTEIPLEIDYRRGTDRVVEQVTVPIAVQSTTAAPTGPGQGDLLLPAVAGGAVIVLVLVIIVIGWRSSRGDT